MFSSFSIAEKIHMGFACLATPSSRLFLKLRATECKGTVMVRAEPEGASHPPWHPPVEHGMVLALGLNRVLALLLLWQ